MLNNSRKGYPSTNSPNFSVIAEWLTSGEIHVLEKQLLQLYEQQIPKGPVIFIWVEWFI